MTAADATRFAGEAYRTRLVRGGAATVDDKTRLAQEGYRSRLACDAADGQADASELYKVGEKIGDRYEVSAIHHGELGVVYGCFDHQTKLPRALKTVRARHARDKQVLSLFESEASVWISLEKHPYIVRAYLVERFNNVPYVITEYVRGPEGMEGDLRGWLGHPRLTLPVAIAMALQIAQGMQHAVRKLPNLVHRDLKPGNILVNGDGKAMVTDFGLVHAEQSDAGTPAYMSPEQWRAETLDARSDIYAYGCILFEMFTAHRLFPALTERDWESAHHASLPAALTSVAPELPSEIDRFVRRCLEKDPATRPQNWDEIVAFFAEWYHRLTGKAVVLDFSSLALDAGEWLAASYSLGILKRYEEMLLACDRALAIDPSHEAAWLNKGFALHYLKRYEEALQTYDRALAIAPNYVLAWDRKGDTLRDLKRYAEAIQVYDQALAIDPNRVSAWDGKGNTLRDLKRYAEAIQAYDRALAIDPKNVRAPLIKSNALYCLNRYEEGLGAYDGAVTLDPNSATRAIALRLSTLSEGATVTGIVNCITDYGVFVDLDGPDGPEGLLHIVDLAWRRVKHPSEVLNVGDKVTAKVLKIDKEKNRVSLGLKQLGEDPWVGVSLRYPHGTRLLGEVTNLTDHGFFVEIEAGIEGLVHTSEMDWTNKNVYPSKILQTGDEVEVMILAIDEERRRVSLSMKQCTPNPWEDCAREVKDGDSLADNKRYGAALAAYDRALALRPDDAQAWFKKGNALLRLERYEEALAAYEHTSSLDANGGGVSYIKGFALLKLKRYEESISACDRALAINPSFAMALNTKSLALQELKPRESAPPVERPQSFWSRLWDK
jgi:tetratricopeptide (TPR) repeat protein